jgi:hypothetical protein
MLKQANGAQTKRRSALYGEQIGWPISSKRFFPMSSTSVGNSEMDDQRLAAKGFGTLETGKTHVMMTRVGGKVVFTEMK